MKISRSKFIALITGFISVIICVVYLLLITVFDFRSILNNYLISNPNQMAVIFLQNRFLF